jgi:hypothetical protein
MGRGLECLRLNESASGSRAAATGGEGGRTRLPRVRAIRAVERPGETTGGATPKQGEISHGFPVFQTFLPFRDEVRLRCMVHTLMPPCGDGALPVGPSAVASSSGPYETRTPRRKAVRLIWCCGCTQKILARECKCDAEEFPGAGATFLYPGGFPSRSSSHQPPS